MLHAIMSAFLAKKGTERSDTDIRSGRAIRIENLVRLIRPTAQAERSLGTGCGRPDLRLVESGGSLGDRLVATGWQTLAMMGFDAGSDEATFALDRRTNVNGQLDRSLSMSVYITRKAQGSGGAPSMA